MFQTAKKQVDEALALFSDEQASGEVLMESYGVYLDKFKEALATVQALTPEPNDVHQIMGESKLKEFVQGFRELLRNSNIMRSFAEYDATDLGISEDTFKDYQSHYYDLKDKRTASGDKISVLDEIDFEVDLLHRDIIRLIIFYRS